MPTFAYSARSDSGGAVSGQLEAVNRKAALRQLAGQGLVPVRLDESSSGDRPRSSGQAATLRERVSGRVSKDSSSEEAKPVKLSRRDRLPFLRALSELLSCGVPTGDGVRMLSRRLSAGSQKVLVVRIWEEVSQGQSLSAAMRAQTGVFDESSISLVEAGEATGNLSEILARLVVDLEEREEIRTRILTALAYPMFIVLVALGVVVVFLFFLLPKIETLLDALGGNLPIFTRILIVLSDLLISWGPVFLVGGVLGGVSLWAWRKTPRGRTVVDERSLKLPGLGSFLRDSDLLRLVQTLALLLENGITTITALALTERTILNTTIRKAFGEARLKIAEGMAVSNALRTTGFFPDLVLDILLIGENTGNLVPSLKEMVRYYHKRQNRQINFFISALSIGVLLAVFVFVALIVFGIVTAVLSLSSNLRVR